MNMNADGQTGASHDDSFQRVQPSQPTKRAPFSLGVSLALVVCCKVM